MLSSIKKENILITVFVAIVLLSILEAIIYSFAVDNSIYYWAGMSETDPGGDFYLSLLYSRDLTPYQYGIFPYPPLSVCFCYLITLLCHQNLENITGILPSIDEKLKIFSNIFAFKNANFLLSAIVLIALAFILSNYISGKFDKKMLFVNIVSIALISNSGMLLALVRGNLLIGAVLFTTIFVLYNDSENNIIKNFSLFSLAIAFNIKPYVAVFGMLLLVEKRYKEACKTCIYALSLFLFPFLFLQGSIIENLKAYFIQLLGFGGREYAMIGFKPFINFLLSFVGHILGIELSTNKIGFIISLLLSVILLILCFNKMKKWQRIMLLTLVMIMASANYGYILSFMLIPATAFLCEETDINIYNVFYLISFILFMAPIRFTSTRTTIYLINVLLILTSIVLASQIVWRKDVN